MRRFVQGNKLLAGLPVEERERLEPYLEPVSLEFDEVLVEFDHPIEYVYFLDRVVTSTVVRTPHGDTIEVGLMGAEGFVGLSLVYGVELSNGTVIVQLPGQALRMKAEDFNRHIKEKGGPCLDLLLRYANFFHVMVQQHAACNAAHRIEERMCRWILLTHDRVEGDEFPLTQEYLSLMLGVRRPTVSEVAHKLKEAGLINYTRGNLTVTDRPGLEAHACECYEMIKEQTDRTFLLDKPSNRYK
ncbi:MAG TPA: Crp/Fnr family transcriptional regulator [Pyrinomonadaceae bacterium]|nr:Crp/Fnr family transcriptional regulator [Pyrinomonadaceae bacterium]